MTQPSSGDRGARAAVILVIVCVLVLGFQLARSVAGGTFPTVPVNPPTTIGEARP